MFEDSYDKISVNKNIISIESDQCEYENNKINIELDDNIKSIKVSSGCTGVQNMYYLTVGHEVYSIDFGEACYYKENNDPKLIAEDVESIDLYDYVYTGFDTCGGGILTYKKNNKYYIDDSYYDEEGNYISQVSSIDKYKMGYIWYNEYSLFVIPESNKDIKWIDNTRYLKDQRGNEIYAKYIFTGYSNECLAKMSIDEIESEVFFIVDENDMLYYYPYGLDYNNSKGYLYKNIKVKNIHVKDQNTISIEYEGSMFEDIYLNYLFEVEENETVKDRW